ncbi:class I SAM-dependent methyltransferase [Chloroflexota bacterium]
MANSEGIQERYDELFKQCSLGEHKDSNYYRQTMDLLESSSQMSILDVGCGYGFLLDVAMSYGIQNATGLDVSQNAIRHAKQRAPLAKYVHSTIEDCSFEDQSFDIITCLGTIEHVADTELALKQMNRILKSNGKILINFPNRRSPLKWAIRLIQWIMPKRILNKSTLIEQPLDRLWSYDEAKSLLRKHELRIIKESYCNKRSICLFGIRVPLPNLPKVLSFVFIFVATKEIS